MQQSKSKLFLIELIIIILFFAIASAVCMNIFAQGKVYSEKSTELTMAATLCQQAAETFKGTDGDEAAMAALLDASWDGEIMYIDYGSEFRQTTGEKQALYRMEVTFEEEEGIKSAEITLSKAQEQIYSLEAAQYTGVL